MLLRDGPNLRGIFRIVLRCFRQTCAQRGNILIYYGQSKALHLVEAPVAALNGQFPDSRLIRLTCGTGHTHERSLFPPKRLDVVRPLQAGSNLGHDHRFAVHVMHGDVGNDQRLATIDNGVGDGVHYRKHFVFGNTHHAKCLILNAEHQATTLPIGERHHGFGVVDAAGRRQELIFHVLGFASQQYLNIHISPSSSPLCGSLFREGAQVSGMIRFCFTKDTKEETSVTPNLSINFCNNSPTPNT